MPSPSGINTIAGPGKTIIATPISKTVKPIAATIARLSQVNCFSAFFIGLNTVAADFVTLAAIAKQSLNCNSHSRPFPSRGVNFGSKHGVEASMSIRPNVGFLASLSTFAHPLVK
jgi:hypothetical protein